METTIGIRGIILEGLSNLGYSGFSYWGLGIER